MPNIPDRTTNVSQKSAPQSQKRRAHHVRPESTSYQGPVFDAGTRQHGAGKRSDCRGWYTNEQDSQSVVHSHPYYELVLPLVGSNVRYSVDGNIYDINLGEMIIFPARCYHAGMFNITDKISERSDCPDQRRSYRQEALLAAAGWFAPTWLGQLVILDAGRRRPSWDLRGLFERMAQTLT